MIEIHNMDCDLVPVDPPTPRYRPFTVEEIVARREWKWRRVGTSDEREISRLSFAGDGAIEFASYGSPAYYIPSLLAHFECRNPSTGQWERAGVEVPE